MESLAAQGSSEALRLLHRAAAGDQEVWASLFTQHRQRLRCMIALRMDRRLQGRIDPSDVLQEAFLHASLKLADYLKNPAMPFFLWLRSLTAQRLLILHRHHLDVVARQASRDVSLYREAFPEASSAALAAHLVGRDGRPSEAAQRAERELQLQQGLDALDPMDREILALRHFEQLSNAEAAQVLDIRESAASKRYIRALQRLKQILTNMPGGFQELEP
jgi:RNA polymerase sigma-70 factor (ECF subfamily)